MGRLTRDELARSPSGSNEWASHLTRLPRGLDAASGSSLSHMVPLAGALSQTFVVPLP